MATYIDVFNGDADGIFSLIQWRKAYPINKNVTQYLVTGVKRDVALVSQIDKALLPEAQITVLDVSFDKNSTAVKQALPICAHIFYCDHHRADTVFSDNKLTTLINTAPSVCTGLLINTELQGAYPLWAITAAFGDGLDNSADEQVRRLKLDNSQRDQLKELGVLVNYNGYGKKVADLHFAPADLYRKLVQYDSPFDIIADPTSPLSVLKQGYEADMTKALLAKRLPDEDITAVILDDAPWARRISGTFGNLLSSQNPDKPVVIITTHSQGTYTISLRAPKGNLYGASTICSQFATGGGREGAAGVNQLPIRELDDFLTSVRQFYSAKQD